MKGINRREFMTVAASAPLLAPVLRGASAGAAEGGKRYRACVIGDTQQGGYGHDLHMLWSLRDDVDVVGLADPDEEGRASHGEQCKAATLYADYREMLEKERPDLVAIGPRWTPNHKDYFLACAEIGAHGITEKPLSSDQQAADDIIAALDTKGLKWAIAFNFRASPLLHHAKKVLFEEKIIGEVLEMRARGKEDQRAGGEDLIVLGIHLFDIMRFFAGDPRWCSAYIGEDDRPSTPADIREATEPLGPIIGNRVNASYGFANGITGYFASVMNPDGNQGRWGIDVFGTKGILTVRQGVVPQLELLQDPTWAPGRRKTPWTPVPGRPKVEEETNRVGHYRPIIDDLIASIEADRTPMYSIQDGRAAQEFIQGAFEAHVQGARIPMPLERRDHPLNRWQ